MEVVPNLNKMVKIAVIITCHNRIDYTLSCLEKLFNAQQYYNNRNTDSLFLSLYITDDGCTDGTPDEIRKSFKDRDIHIITGSGQLFWAGGMRLAWKTAVEDPEEWDFYLMLNDDTMMSMNCIEILFNTHQYSIDKFGRAGIYSGITSYIDRPDIISYGGSIWINRLLAKTQMLQPTGTPQLCDMTNANILLVPAAVFDELGIFYDGYQHAIADYDYTIQARKKGFPVLVTGDVCAECDDDHGTLEENGQRICAMSLKERIQYFHHPLHSNKDYLLFIRRNAPFRYPMVLLGRFLNVYCPRIYYKLFSR